MSSLLTFGLTIDIEYKEMCFVCSCVPCVVICEIICYICRKISPFLQLGVSLNVETWLSLSFLVLYIQDLP